MDIARKNSDQPGDAQADFLQSLVQCGGPRYHLISIRPNHQIVRDKDGMCQRGVAVSGSRQMRRHAYRPMDFAESSRR